MIYLPIDAFNGLKIWNKCKKVLFLLRQPTISISNIFRNKWITFINRKQVIVFRKHHQLHYIIFFFCSFHLMFESFYTFRFLVFSHISFVRFKWMCFIVITFHSSSSSFLLILISQMIIESWSVLLTSHKHARSLLKDYID